MIEMKYYNYRFSFTKIFTYTDWLFICPLPVLSPGNHETYKMKFPHSISNEQETGSKEITPIDITSDVINIMSPTKGYILKGQTGGCCNLGISRMAQKRQQKKKLPPFLPYFLKKIGKIQLYFVAYISNAKINESIQFDVFQEKNRLQVFQFRNINIYLMLS